MRHVLAVIACVTGAACARTAEQLPPRTVPASPVPAVREDVAFMHGMIVHHGQALEMAKLAAVRAGRADIKLLAERIDASQVDEINRMKRWLAARDVSDHGHTGHTAMPGMLTPFEMNTLANASGLEFDRLFLELMIRHHEGALIMVEQLFLQGGVQDPELHRFASDVDADQRAEIARMRRLLETLK